MTPLAAILAAVGAAALLIQGRAHRRLLRRARTTAERLEQLQRAFQRFAPAEVVESVIAHGVAVRSEKRVVTILFADLRGFTALSERLDPGELVEILNGYFGQMSLAISRHRGHVSKFIGDGILALFGALDLNPWQTDDAAHAALAMCEGLVRYNERLRARGWPELSVGIGLHRGTVVAGVIGTTELMEYTVIGAEVNLAARVESLTREHGAQILLTGEARRALDPRFRLRAMPPREVKGISAPVATWSLEGLGVVDG